MASQNRKMRQRAQRREKRQLQTRLSKQSQENITTTPIGVFKNINTSFYNFSISETERDIKNGNVGRDRVPLLKEAIDLGIKIRPKNINASNIQIQILSTAFETGKRR